MAEGGAMVPRSSVAEVVMAVDVAVAAMAHGRGRGWGGAELCGRGGAVGGGGAGNLRSARDARQPPGHGGDGCAVGGGRKKSFFYLERGRKGAGRTSVRVFFICHVGPTLLFTINGFIPLVGLRGYTTSVRL